MTFDSMLRERYFGDKLVVQTIIAQLNIELDNGKPRELDSYEGGRLSPAWTVREDIIGKMALDEI